LWNAGTGALKLRRITMKRNISFVSVYLQYMCLDLFFWEVPLLFDLPSYFNSWLWNQVH
jgi:hypothetical protein